MDKNTTVADAISGMTMGDLGDGLGVVIALIVIFLVVSVIGSLFTRPKF